MKFAVVLAAAAVATASAYSTTDCSSSVAATAFGSLASILGEGNLDKCASESTYNMLYATALPTEEQTKKMCGLASCKALISSVEAKNPPDCLIPIPTSPTQFKLNIYGLVKSFPTDCARLNPAPTTAPSPSVGPSPTTGPTTPTAAPPAGTPSATPAPTKVAC